MTVPYRVPTEYQVKQFEFALWLVEQGISSISLTPDSVVQTWFDSIDFITGTLPYIDTNPGYNDTFH